MKKLNLLSKIGVAFALFIGITIACTKEVEVKDNFNFKLITNFSENGFIYETEDLTISIIQDRVIKSNKYFFKFQQEEGEGTFQIENGTIVHSLENEKIEVKRNEILKYLPTTVGHHKIKGTIYDLYDNKSEFTLETDIDYSPFTFIYTTATNVYPINQKSPTSLTYIQEGEENFKFEYYIEGGTGSLFLGDEELEQNEEIEMETGAMILKYLPTTLEEHTIHVKAIANDGGERNAEIVINVTNVDFNIQATPQGNSVNLNIDLPITISLTTADESGDVSYKIKYEYLNDSNTGVIKNQDGEEKAPGVLWDIAPGSYNFSYNSQQEGDAEIKFTVIDSNEQEKEDTIIFSVENVPFTFTGSTVTNDIYINQETGFNFTLTPDGNTEAISYTVSYSQSEGNGVLKNQNGDVIAPNTDIEITPGAFSFNFTPQSLGDHNLLFIAKDNFGQEVEVTIELTTEHIPVTFIVTATNSMIVGQTTNVNFVITPQITTDTTYEMNYILVGGEGELKNNTGTIIDTGIYQDVNTGSFVYTYSPSTQGNHVLNFQLRDSNTQIVLADKTIVVTNNNFTFTAVAEDESILVNNQTNINCNLNTSVTGNTNYYLTMTKTGANSNLSLNGTNLIAGNEIQFSPGSFTLLHEPLEVGTTNYVLTMRDDLGNEVIRDIDIEAGQLDFNLNVTQPQHIFINQENTFTFALVPTGSYDGITYQMSYDVQNPQLGNFDNHTEAVPFNVVPVSFDMNYTPTTLGVHEITFTVIDSNGQSHDYTETFEVVAADFTWTVNQSNVEILYNTPDNISAVLSQVITNNNVTYSISYTISGGPGQLLNENGITLSQGTIVPGSYNYQFIASQTGNYIVNLIITDSNNISHNVELNYTVIHTDFELYCSNLADMDNNTIQDFNINLIQNIDDTNVQYEIKFNVVLSSTGDGNITDENDNVLSGWQAVNIGVNNYRFVADTSGGVELLTEIREQGLDTTIKSCSNDFVINPFTVTFTGSAQNSTINLNDNTNINFNITELPSSNHSYTLSYTYQTGSGLLAQYNGGSALATSTPIAVALGQNIWNFTGTQVGNVSMDFVLTDVTTGETYPLQNSIDIVVNSVPYCNPTIMVQGTQNSAYIGENTPVNLTFGTDTVGTCQGNYEMYFTLPNGLNGEFTLNGITNGPNQNWRNIDFGNITGVYKGLNAGDHNIIFHFVNTDNNTENTDNFNISISDCDFTINGSFLTNGGNIGSDVAMLFDFEELGLDCNTTYRFRFSTTGGNGNTFTYNGNEKIDGQWFDFDPTILSGFYTGVNSGYHNVTFEFESIATQTSHSFTKSISFNSPTFLLSCYGGGASVELSNGDNAQFTTVIDQSFTDTNVVYDIRYSFLNGDGIIKKEDGTEIQSNIWLFNQAAGTYLRTFTATVSGDVTIQTEVIEHNNLNTLQTCTTQFSVIEENCDFTFDIAQEENGQAPINSSQKIDIGFTETGTNCNTPYQMYFTTKRDGVNTSDGYLTYQGNTKNQGITNAFTVTPGTFSVYYTTDVAGEYEITFYITNPNASITSQEKNVTIEFINPNININLVSQDNDILVLNDATYNFEIIGGSGNFEVSVNPNVNVSVPSLKINNTLKNWAETENTGSQIELKLTPTQLAQNDSYTMHVHDIDNNIDNDYTFNLNSNQPTFTLQNVYLTNNDIWSDESTSLHVEVNTNGYNHSLTYNYEYGITGYLTDEDFTEGPPSPHNFDIEANGEIGSLQAIITVTNVEYGYSTTQQVAFNSNDIMFNWNNINLFTDGEYVYNFSEYTPNPLENTEDHIVYANHLVIEPILNLGKYPIDRTIVTTVYDFLYNSAHIQKTIVEDDFNFSNLIILNNTKITANKNNFSNDWEEKFNDSSSSSYVWSFNQNTTSSYDDNNNDLKLIENFGRSSSIYNTVITVKIYDTENNFIEHVYTINNGWGVYTPD